MSERRHSPSADRNKGPIAEVLAALLPRHGTLLEIASGTGQHVAHLAPLHPELHFQPTDADPGALAAIDARCADLANVRPALVLDVTAEWPLARAEAMLAINLIHIAPWQATLALLAGAARLLPPGAPLVLYGPYRRGGAHTAPSNAAFDVDLRQRDPAYGVRDLEQVTAAAAERGLSWEGEWPMPANNLTLLFRRAPGA